MEMLLAFRRTFSAAALAWPLLAVAQNTPPAGPEQGASQAAGAPSPSATQPIADEAQMLERQGRWQEAYAQLQARWQAAGPTPQGDMDAYLARDRLLGQLIDNSRLRLDDPAQLKWLNERLALRSAFWGEHEAPTLAVRNARALQWCAMGRCTEALAEQEAIYRHTLAQQGPDARNTLTARHNLTASLADLGRHEEALAIARELAAQAERLWGPQDEQTLRLRNGVAVGLTELGRYADALLAHEQVYALRQQALGPTAAPTLNSLRGIGLTYSLLRRHRQAVGAMQQHLKLWREAVGDAHPATAAAQMDLALALRRLGRLGDARQQGQAAWQQLQKLRGEHHPSTLDAMNIYASILLAEGDAQAALPLTREAWDKRRALTGEQHPQALRARESLGLAYLQLGDAQQALTELEQTHEDMRQVLGDNHPDTLLALLSRMQAALAAGQLQEMRPWMKRFQSGLEALRAQHGLSVKSRRSLFQRYVDGYRLHALAEVRAGDGAAAFALAELSKARTLLEGTALQGANRSGVLPPEAQAEVDAALDRLARLDEQIDTITVPERRQPLQAERNRVQRAFADTVARLRETYPRYARLAEPPQAKLADARRWLPEGTLMLSYLLVQERGMLFALDHTGLRRALELPALPGLVDTVDAFRRLQGDALEDGQAIWQLAPGHYRAAPRAKPPTAGAQIVRDPAQALADMGQRLAKHLLEPVREELNTHTQLLISPDSMLALLPFDALPWAASNTASNAPNDVAADTPRWLAQTHGVSYVQSLSMLGLLKQRSAQYQRLPDRRPLLAVGNPVYQAEAPAQAKSDESDKSDKSDKNAESAAATEATRSASAQERTLTAQALAEAESDDSVQEAMSLLREADWDELPGTAREVAAVRRALPAGSVDALTGEQASESRLQALNQSGDLARYQRLLFSTHGFLSPGVPALNALVLSQAGNPRSVDGYITAAEWPGYTLQSDLVVMSACETGLGRVVQGEGVLGLPYALYVAGNTHTVMTLWQVADESTATFMEAFFKRLNAGETPDAALAATKRDFAHGLHGDKLRRPFYWAPFVLYGTSG